MKITTLTRPLALTAVAALTFTLAGCSGSDQPAAVPEPASTTSSSAPPAASSAPASPSPSASASASETASAPTSDPKSSTALLAAGRLGQREVSGGTVISIESEGNGWEVHVVTNGGAEKELRINATGKRVVAGPVDDRPDAEDRAENQQFATADISYREAVKAVEAEIKGGEITEISLDRDIGRTLWEANVMVDAQERSVQINANNGKVVSNQLDD